MEGDWDTENTVPATPNNKTVTRRAFQAVSSVLQTFRFFARHADFSSGEPRISLMARIKQFYP